MLRSCYISSKVICSGKTATWGGGGLLLKTMSSGWNYSLRISFTCNIHLEIEGFGLKRERSTVSPIWPEHSINGESEPLKWACCGPAVIRWVSYMLRQCPPSVCVHALIKLSVKAVQTLFSEGTPHIVVSDWASHCLQPLGLVLLLASLQIVAYEYVAIRSETGD